MVMLNIEEYYSLGRFALVVTTDGQSEDITLFREIATQISDYSKSDPFGDKSLQFNLPQISSLDTLGIGDLWWCKPWSDINLYWIPKDDEALLQAWVDKLEDDGYAPDSEDTLLYAQQLISEGQYPAGYDFNRTLVWAGFIASFARESSESSSSLKIECKGALYQLDNYVSQPTNPVRPVPYEIIIKDAFSRSDKPDLKTKELTTTFPSNWTTTAPTYAPELNYLAPLEVNPGDKWSGLATRSTGDWSPLLTGYVQNLLSVMYTGTGSQWTITNKNGREPHLFVRERINNPDSETLFVDVISPGVTASLSQDFSQVANVVYGQGKDYAGSEFSNAVGIVPSNGENTMKSSETVAYDPFIAIPKVYPASSDNLKYDPSSIRKEVHQTFQDGLTYVEATEVARQYLTRFSEPGWVGNITLKIDPVLDTNKIFARFLIQPGMRIVLKNFNGSEKTIMFHIADVSINVDSATVSLTVDTKYRDLLTIEEVRERGRDALEIRRFLKNNRLRLPFDDYLKPWDYNQGSGLIPYYAKPLFDKIPNSSRFPWTEFTKQYPPKDKPQYYIKVGKKNVVDSSYNWGGDYNANETADGDSLVTAAPILLAAKGTVDLTQIAAYDKDGNVKPVSFHASIYKVKQLSPQALPKIPIVQLWAKTLTSTSSHNITTGSKTFLTSDTSYASAGQSVLVTFAGSIIGVPTLRSSTGTTRTITISSHKFNTGETITVQLEPYNSSYDGSFTITGTTANTITYSGTDELVEESTSATGNVYLASSKTLTGTITSLVADTSITVNVTSVVGSGTALYPWDIKPTSGIGSTDTNILVTGNANNWPRVYPFNAVINPDSTNPEEITVSSMSSYNSDGVRFNVVRGQNSTTARAHSFGSTVHNKAIPYRPRQLTATPVAGSTFPNVAFSNKTTTGKTYTVDSTAGFPDKGHFYLDYNKNTNVDGILVVAYTSKTSTTFVNCKLVDFYTNGQNLFQDYGSTAMPDPIIRLDITQPYPFYPGAFESINEDGTQKSETLSTAPDSLVIGWGNYYQRSGYYPGLMTSGSPKTGKLVDEEDWAFDTTEFLDPTKVGNGINDSPAMHYIYIYCDDHTIDEDVYFLGRLFKKQTTGG